MNSVDQTALDRKLAAVERLLAEAPAMFARQGAVVAGWRRVGERRLGPYYALRYRRDGRQRSFYLGPSEELAGRVRAMLERMQRPGADRRQIAQVRAAVRASLRQHRRQWLEQLQRAQGLTLHGYQLRRGSGASCEARRGAR